MATDPTGRPHVPNEARETDPVTFLRVFGVKGEPSPGDVPVVNADLNLEFGAGATGAGQFVPFLVGDDDDPILAITYSVDGVPLVALMWEEFI
jgi:hypothetical protein